MAAQPDRQLLYLERFQTGLRSRLREQLSDELVAQYRQNLTGPHSDALMRLLVYFGSLGAYALYSPVPLREFVILRLPGGPGLPPEPVDARVFDREDDARVAMFLLQVADLRRTEET